MSKSLNSKSDSLTLADEIRSSEPLYLAAAVQAFQERFNMEYYRLRGYAIEAGDSKIELTVTVHCDFVKRVVAVESTPRFIPEKGMSTVKLKPADEP